MYDEAFKNINLDDYEKEIMENCDTIFQGHIDKNLIWRNMLSEYKVSIEKDIKNNFKNICIENNGNMLIVRTSDKKVAILYNWFDWKIPVCLFNHHRFKGSKSVDCILNFTFIPYENTQ